VSPGGAPAATAERPGRAIDPRIAQRRAAVRRGESRRRFLPLLAVALAAALAVDAWMVLHSRLFAARHVVVVGAVHSGSGAVVSAADLWAEPALLTLDTAAVANRVEALPWVARAQVRLAWPDTVRITVTERVPVAQVAGAGGYAEVDRTGRVLAWSAHPFPVVSVVGAPPPGAAGSSVPGASGALAVAASLPPAFATQVQAVVEQPGGQVALALTVPVTVTLGTPTQLAAKYEDVAAVLAGATLHAGDVLDVSVPSSPIVTSR
jgi:cell division protein FtsQ